MSSGEYRIVKAVTRAFDQNAYILWREGRTDAVVVDPGYDLAPVHRCVREHGLELAAILNTHGHLDHMAGNAPLRAASPSPPIWIGRADAPMLTDPALNLSLHFGDPVTSPPADHLLDDGERFELAGFRFEARLVPGHSPGSMVYLGLDDDRPPFAISGDVVFRDSIGRTDFPGGSQEQLLAGIRSRVLSLADELVLHPGHGPETTVGRERRLNPYLAGGRAS